MGKYEMVVDISLKDHSKKYIEAFRNYYEGQEQKNRLSLKGKGEDSLSAWFLGPKAENADLLKSLILEALNYHIEYRRHFHPEDPRFITKDTMATDAYKIGVEELRKNTKNLLVELEQSVPFFTMRYLGHMNWETTLPGMIGYFAAMLYNPNNVAVEASPVTTKLEMEVGNDLCRMLGYSVPHSSSEQPSNSVPGITPWGHITCDGSVANLEGLWASRNLKFFPIALNQAILNEHPLSNAKSLEVKLLDGNIAKLVDLDTWTLLNLKADDVLSLPQTMDKKYGIPTATTAEVLQTYSLQNMGLLEFYNKYFKDEMKHHPVAFTPVTKHYSWPKSAAILGIGANNVLGVRVDVDGRMDLHDLENGLQQCLDIRQPVITVVAVIGSTEESAVDPLEGILEIREEFRKKGLDFTIHADAAWGGYFASLLREDDEKEYDPSKMMLKHFIPSFPLSDYVINQYRVLKYVDSITIDPHKAGYIPYPAGGLCYRNSAMRNLVSFTAPVIYHNDIDPTVGIYGVEGSKAGAAATATYLSHRVIRPTKNGYGRILGECIFTSKRLYCQLVSIRDSRFIVVPFQRLPAEREGKDPEDILKQIDEIRENIVDYTNEELIKNEKAMDLLREVGSDQLIIPYIFNFKDKSGKLNNDAAKMNELNSRVFKILSMVPGDKADSKTLIVTSSEFKLEIYGREFMNSIKDRLGIKDERDLPISFIISTVMNPWLTDLHGIGSPSKTFLGVVEKALRDAVYKALDEMGV
jgi:glutamate/tyrosine decarboxylase-like PLP-dependent enzyme